MLAHITISNYTIVSELDMAFSPGMTVITGETGAGKSIMLDALGLCLGDRADPKSVRHGSERAEITASFDIAAIPQAISWLKDRDLHTGDECLIDIHSQHAHQSLLRKPMQRDLLDAYAGHRALTQAVEQHASDWLRKRRELELLAGSRDEHTSRMQLLAYQVEELDTLNLQENELGELEQEQVLLGNAEDILVAANRALELCEQQESGTHQALKLLDESVHATRTAGTSHDVLCCPARNNFRRCTSRYRRSYRGWKMAASACHNWNRRWRNWRGSTPVTPPSWARNDSLPPKNW